LDPRFLDYGRERLLGGLAGFQKSRKVRSLAQLWYLQVKRAEPGFQLTLLIAVAICRALTGAFMAPGADQAIDLELHQPLERVGGNGAQKVAVGTRRYWLGSGRAEVSSCRRSSCLSRVLVWCCNSTLLKQPDDHLRVVAAPGRRVKATRVPLCELHPSRLNPSGINSHHSSGRYRFKKEIAESDLPPAPPEKETP